MDGCNSREGEVSMRKICRAAGFCCLLVALFLLCSCGNDPAAAPQDSEPVNVEELVLTGLEFYYKGVSMSDTYKFTLEQGAGGMTFSAHFFGQDSRVIIREEPVEDTVREEMEQMAKRQGGLSHGPAQYDGPPKGVAAQEYVTWRYAMTWSDGTVTDAGPAQEQMAEYLRELGLEIGG